MKQPRSSSPSLGAASANGEVIEVYGPSRSGKTELLLHVSCWWALSASRGGGGRSVVFLDTESRLCRPRLRAVAEALVASRPREPDAEADAKPVVGDPGGPGPPPWIAVALRVRFEGKGAFSGLSLSYGDLPLNSNMVTPERAERRIKRRHRL